MVYLLHGDQDPQMPINQSHELNGAYRKAQLDGRLQVIHGAAHGGRQFYSGASQRAVIDFLFTKAFKNNSADRR